MPIFQLKFFFEDFGQYLKTSKNGFPIVFSKSDLTGVGSFFGQKKLSEKAKHPKICLSLGGSIPEAQIKQCPLTPSPKNGPNLIAATALYCNYDCCRFAIFQCFFVGWWWC